MSVTETQAEDLLFARLNTAITSGSTALVGYVPTIFWPNITGKALPSAGKYIIKVYTAVTQRAQKTIGRPAWWQFNGSCFVVVLTPRSQPAGAAHAKALADLIKNAFEGKRENAGVRYRQCISREIPAEGDWFQYRVEIRFEGDELK